MCAKAGQSCYCRLLVALQRLPHLRELDLSHNGLSEMPDILTSVVVPSLTTLRMTGNELKTIPSGILQLPSLMVRALVSACRSFNKLL
jgi:Leucine-rich repeat (LRR) protein